MALAAKCGFAIYTGSTEDDRYLSERKWEHMRSDRQIGNHAGSWRTIVCVLPFVACVRMWVDGSDGARGS